MRQFTRSLALILVIAVFLTSGLSCQARDYNRPDTIMLLPQKRIKAAPRDVEIYQYDESELGNRKPLLLVHGLLGEYHPQFRWKELAEFLSEQQDFQKKYKIYLTRFDTRLSLKESTKDFGRAVRQFASTTPTKTVSLVAISLAGTVIRDSMNDPEVCKSIDRVITLGSFFRGSPLFCADWMRQTIKKRYLSPLTQVDHLLGYKIYFARHKNLQRDFAWDNSDGQMYTKRKRKPTIVQRPLNAEEQKAVDQKFFAYAGYLHNKYVPREHGPLRVLIASPFSFFKTTLPMHLDREHPALRFLNDFIARAVPKLPPEDDIIYPLNDGISPIASSLLLSDDFAARKDINKMQDLSQIRKNTNAGKVRLFDNVDHLTYIERKRPIGSSEKITDKLSVDEEPRAMFDWILKDLMEK